MQKWIGVGRLTKDPEKIEANDKKAFCKFILATNENYSKDGKPAVSYHTIIVWNAIAENCLKYLSKGSLVSVVGRVQYRNWEDANGEKKYVTEIIGEEISFLSTKKVENE